MLLSFCPAHSFFASLCVHDHSPFTPEEDCTIQQAYENYGNRWTQIAELLPGRTEDAVKLRWKSLNPNIKTNDRPGRPKLVPGMNTNKPRSTAPPNPDEIAAAIMAPIPDLHGNPRLPPYQDAYASSSYDYNNANASMYATPSMAAMAPLQPHPQQQPHQQYVQAHAPPPPAQHQTHLRSDLPEPIVEPQESKEEVDSKDAAILKELLRSFSNSLMSFESSRGLTSISDMSPEDLLASGELDEMLRQVSLANRPPGTASSKSSFKLSGRTSSSRSSFNLSSGSMSKMDSFSRAVNTMGQEEKKNMFQGLIDQLRASGGDINENNVLNLPMDSGLFTSFSSNSAKNLLHSLDYEDDESDNDIARSTSIGLSPAVADATSDIDDLFDPSVMRPIRKGVQY